MLQALGDRILVDPVPTQEHQSAMGLTLPDLAKRNPPMGTVVSVGKHVSLFRVGDFVFYAKHAGADVRDGAKEYKMLREREITAKQ